jgi:flagellar biosynthetic protein FliR
MNLEMLNLLDKFYAVIWPLLRISAFLAFASIFSIRAVNLRIRVVIALVFAFFVSMQIDIPVIDPLTGPGLAEIFNQVFIGFAMGMIMQIATAGVVVAGQVVSGSMGLTMATLIDPNVGNVPVISGLFNVLGTLLFLAMGGHLIVFGILLDSFTVFPIGKSLMTQDVYGKMLAWSAMMFLASVLIGVIQTFAVAIDYSFLTLAKDMGWALSAATQENSFAKLTLSQVAPILPYLFLVLILIFRPKGLLGTREG